jgi:hypothetical protein
LGENAELREIKRSVDRLVEHFGPRQRHRESTNFFLATLSGLFIGIATTATVDALATYAETGGAVANNPRFAATVILVILGLVVASAIYQHYKTVNEVVDYSTVTYAFKSQERVHDVCQLIRGELDISELKELGLFTDVEFDRLRKKGVTRGVIYVRKPRLGRVLTKRVASLDISEGLIKVEAFMDSEGDTAMMIINSRLQRLGSKGIGVTLPTGTQ